MIQITAIDGNIVYARLTGRASAEAFEQEYECITELTAEYDRLHFYEEVESFTTRDFFSVFSGFVPDLRHGPNLDLGRVAVVGGGLWMELLVGIWRLISLIWPLSPDELRYFPQNRADEARRWIDQSPRRKLETDITKPSVQ